MLLSAVIGISVASYIQLTRTALNISNRSLYNNAAINYAEQGIEEAMYGINQMVADSSYEWPHWNRDGLNIRRRWRGVDLSQNATADYRVYLYNFSGTPAPKAVARARITLGGSNSAPIEKWIEVQLAKTSKFSNGLVAKNSIVFNGNNAMVDSWNSDPNGNSSVIHPYLPAYRNDNGSVGSISVSSSAVLVKNADVWGFVATGGADPTSFVGANGSILGSGSTADATWTNSSVDPSRISTNFSATFDAVVTPTPAAITNLGTLNTDGQELPQAADVAAGRAASDGYYYYDGNNINLVNKVLIITGKVVLRLSNTGTSVNVGGGSGEIRIGTTGALSIYAPGAVSMSGKGISNGVESNGTAGLQAEELGQPIKFQIWGTAVSPATQAIDVKGNGAFSGLVYAPQGTVSVVGNGAVCGSIVANNITLTGNAEFHYDESLSNFGGGNPFRVSVWRELTSASDRAAYSSVMTGWTF